MTRKYISLMAAAAMMFGASTVMAKGHRAAATTAQTQPTGDHLEKLKAALAQLDLSTTQKSQIKKIMADAKVAKAAVIGAPAGKGKGHDTMKKVIGVLTETQKTKLKQLMKAGRHK